MMWIDLRNAHPIIKIAPIRIRISQKSQSFFDILLYNILIFIKLSFSFKY